MFEATDLDDDRRQVAIKVIAKQRRDHLVGELFSREQSYAQALFVAPRNEHEQSFFVEVIASNRSRDQPFLVMECLLPPLWETLRALLDRRGQLSEGEVVELGIQLTRALTRMKDKRIVHCDLKPENIFVQFGPCRIKISDLGGAVDNVPQTTLAKSASVLDTLMLGTPGYMSPEHLARQTMTPAADVFSLACVLWECASGELPFHPPHDYNDQQAVKVWCDAISARRAKGGDKIVEGLRDLLFNMLAFDASSRPTAAELRRMLEHNRVTWLMNRIGASGKMIVHQGEALIGALDDKDTANHIRTRAEPIDSLLGDVTNATALLKDKTARLQTMLAGIDVTPLPNETPSNPVEPFLRSAPGQQFDRGRVGVAAALGFGAAVGLAVLVFALLWPSRDTAATAPRSLLSPACDGKEPDCNLRALCDAGELEACVVAAQMLDRTDAAAAGELRRKACDGHISAACRELARRDYNNAGTKVQARAAVNEACQRGDQESCIDNAIMALLNEWESDAQEQLRQGCAAGKSRLCRFLGRLLVFGFDDAHHAPSSGLLYLKSACDAKDLLACELLAKAELAGVPGTDGNPEEIRKLAQPACRAGHDIACVVLGQVQSDEIDKAMWYAYACAEGSTSGCANFHHWLFLYVTELKSDERRDIELGKHVASLISSCSESRNEWACKYAWEDQKPGSTENIKPICSLKAPYGCGDLAKALLGQQKVDEAWELVNPLCADGTGYFDACWAATNGVFQARVTPEVRDRILLRACQATWADQNFSACKK